MSQETVSLKKCETVLFLFFAFSVTDKTHAQGRPHSPLINYGEIEEKLSAQRFQGTFLGGRALTDLFNDTYIHTY